jgi:hypothetical protein
MAKKKAIQKNWLESKPHKYNEKSGLCQQQLSTEYSTPDRSCKFLLALATIKKH